MQTKDFYDSKFLKADDLQGREHKLIVNRLEAIEFKDKTVKPAMYFRNREKGIILNKTNTMKLAGQYGDDMDAWVGKEVIIYPDTVDFQGKPTPAIRLRPVLPQASAVDPNDDIPF